MFCMSTHESGRAVVFMGDLVVLARQARLIREARQRGYAPVAVVGTGTDLDRLAALSAGPAPPLAGLAEGLQVPDAAVTAGLPAGRPPLPRPGGGGGRLGGGVGRDFWVEAVVQQGAVIWSAVPGKQTNEHDSFYYTEPPPPCPAVLENGEAARLVSANTEILRRVGMRDGFTHAEYRLTSH